MPQTIPGSAQGGMFHTFQGVTPRKPAVDSNDGQKSGSSTGNKRITTPHACAECKRRKIRCDGQQPCGQCLSSRAPKRCFYDKHRQRVIPSRKTLEALSQSLEECRSILRRLYPNHEVSALLPLSRHELVGLIDNSVTGSSALPSPPQNTSPTKIEHESPPTQESEGSLISLEPLAAGDMDWDEEQKDFSSSESDVSQDFSHHADRQASYLGASSIKAALMVILKVQPQLRATLAPPLNSVEMANNLPIIRQRSAAPKDTSRVAWTWKGQTLIDAYFKRVHVFVPMLDEVAFRADYLEGLRYDSSWLALLNTVFAMGSIVAMKSDDFNHINYYNRAMEHITLDALGSSQIETVQALTIIGGYYLHYINRPNMANAVIGAAVRMASALGLHRESLAQSSRDLAAAEMRRRTWWSLFCLDTWATTTMGRPSFGRWGPAINIQPPELVIKQTRDSAQDAGILPLIENIKFCKIATRVQDLLATAPLIPSEERCNLDNQLVNWHHGLPWLLRTSDPCAEPLYIARCIMKWRYQNLRMLLHRPVLLHLAGNGSNTPSLEQDMAAVETCRDLAKSTIEDIAREWTRNQMSGWNAVSFLYQAAMIPLVSLFWEWNHPRVPEWQHQIETVLELLDAMEEWSLAARRSREVVWRMYEASRQPSVTEGHGQGVLSGAMDPITLMTTGPEMGIGDGEFHMSPIGLETDDMMSLLDQHSLWDLDGMQWNQQAANSMPVDSSLCGLGEGMMPMDYSTMGGGGGASGGGQTPTLDASFFVH